MKITDIEVIPFRVPRRPFRHGELHDEVTIVQTLTRITTDEGAEGLYLGGAGHGDQDGLNAQDRAALRGPIRAKLLGEDPFDREKFWHWFWVSNTQENLLSVVDMALWDLQARLYDLPLHKLLGGCRDKVRAYASTYPNMGSPEVYGQHAAACKVQWRRAVIVRPVSLCALVQQQPHRVDVALLAGGVQRRQPALRSPVDLRAVVQ